jgi:hypothetical protein
MPENNITKNGILSQKTALFLISRHIPGTFSHFPAHLGARKWLLCMYFKKLCREIGRF